MATKDSVYRLGSSLSGLGDAFAQAKQRNIENERAGKGVALNEMYGNLAQSKYATEQKMLKRQMLTEDFQKKVNLRTQMLINDFAVKQNISPDKLTPENQASIAPQFRAVAEKELLASMTPEQQAELGYGGMNLPAGMKPQEPIDNGYQHPRESTSAIGELMGSIGNKIGRPSALNLLERRKKPTDFQTWKPMEKLEFLTR